MGLDEGAVTHEIIGSEEDTDTDNPSSGQVEGDGTEIVDIELDDRFGGKKKKKRKKRSRSKKRRRRRKNNTKKN